MNRGPGIMEYWNDGIMGKNKRAKRSNLAALHLILPLFQYSRFPSFPKRACPIILSVL
jgi:hypothetical protein